MTTPRKPDRFERLVLGMYFNTESDAKDAVDLLRREHAWMARMVKGLLKECGRKYQQDAPNAAYFVGAIDVLNRIGMDLAKRKG